MSRVAGLGLLALALVAPLGAQTLPANFNDALVTSVSAPTGLAFTPDGRMLITTQPGSLRVFQNGSLLPTPAITFSAICTNSERGLLGVAVDPDFANNRYIFLYYTFRNGASCNSTTARNRVSRFVLLDTNLVQAGSESILIDGIPSPGGNHNGGDLQFGKDGYLYISVGDGGTDYAGDSGSAGANDASRDRHVLLGKVLRIDRDGNIPATNPFQGAGTVRCNTGNASPGQICQEAFTWGHRNPFRIAMDPNASGVRLFINDVGQNVWEEIDEAVAGADYGWNCREGAHANSQAGATCSPLPPNLVDPIYEYRHSQQIPGTTSSANCNSITGGAFVPNGLWPAYDGTYIFADYVCGGLFRLGSSGGPWSASDFALGLGSSSAVALRFGPAPGGQALYYTTYAGGGSVRRISYAVAGNNAPTALLTASPQWGGLPLNVTFDGSGSFDPDAGTTLSYFWDFGDGVQQTTTSASVAHSYGTSGPRTITLRVRDQQFAFSAPVTITVWPGNDPPQPSIASPANGALFTVGQPFTLTGSATDPQQGSLPDSALSWSVLLHHNDHTHPYFGPQTGNNIMLMGPPPEDLAATAASYLEVRLTATDAQGLPITVTRDFQPRRVQLSFATDPAGFSVDLDQAPFVTPADVTSWHGWGLPVNAPAQDSGGRRWAWKSWSDGGARSHAISTPATAASYTATFRKLSAGVDLDSDGTAEVIVYRQGAWLVHRYSTGTYDAVASRFTGQPSASCIPLPMVLDADGATDFTQYCGGAWHFYNPDGSYRKGIWTGSIAGDVPVPADYDGDGIDDVVVFRAGSWLFFDFATGDYSAARSRFTGAPGSSPRPIPMDVDGDARAEFVVFGGGTFHTFHADGSYWKGISVGSVAGDVAVPADYDGDGIDDIVVFRNGAWLFWNFATGLYDAGRSVFTGAPVHNALTPLPAPIDVDGDGKMNFTIYSGGPWHFFHADGSYDRGIWTGSVAGDQGVSRRLLP